MPGPNRKPTPLKLLQGTTRADRSNLNELQPEVVVPLPPHHLSKFARAEWDRMSPLLFNAGLISEEDRSAFAMYCQHYGRHVKAEYMIRKHGETEKTSNGNLIQSPWVGISNTSAQLASKLLSAFGMTPADRSKVSVKEKKGKKPEGKERFFK